VDRLVVSEQTLRHRLRAHGLLASVDEARQTLLVRRTLAGCPRHVLHLKANDVVGVITETGANWRSSHDRTTNGASTSVRTR
jgi:hypothetical protein